MRTTILIIVLVIVIGVFSFYHEIILAPFHVEHLLEYCSDNSIFFTLSTITIFFCIAEVYKLFIGRFNRASMTLAIGVLSTLLQEFVGTIIFYYVNQMDQYEGRYFELYQEPNSDKEIRIFAAPLEFKYNAIYRNLTIEGVRYPIGSNQAIDPIIVDPITLTGTINKKQILYFYSKDGEIGFGRIEHFPQAKGRYWGRWVYTNLDSSGQPTEIKFLLEKITSKKGDIYEEKEALKEFIKNNIKYLTATK